MPGWVGDYEWTGFLTVKDLPQSVNPTNHSLVTANNRCDECYVSIRSYLDKSFPQLLWENVSGFLSFNGSR